ncbi:MAG: hypothetical protein IKO19_09645 [Candidatus Riflebacteria bacterium]|nr:hypothetical protein [Candidatus Riflebacteria bacterium]
MVIDEYKEENKESLNRLKWVFMQLKLESQYGKNALFSLKPYKSNEELNLRNSLLEIEHIVKIFKTKTDLFSKLNSFFKELRYISGSINNLINNQTLDETELFEIKNFSILATDIIELSKKEAILPTKLAVLDLTPVIKLLNPDKIITRSFFIHESWSDKLKEIRENKKNIEAKILQTVDSKEKEKLRSKRAEIVGLERDEELEVRKQLTSKLKEFEKGLKFTAENIGLFELMLAKAELALEYDCCLPEIYDSNTNKPIVVDMAIEPEIAESLKKSGKSFTPVTIEIQNGVTLLTGANMGGKSVALKTIALNTELVRYGFLPFAQKMSLKIPEFIKVISGDQQNAIQGLSSFGAEIVDLTELLEKLEKSSGLAVCDELGRSTNPFEGSRFVQALSDKLQSSSSYGIIATHYDGIQTDGAAYYRVAGLRTLLEGEAEDKSISCNNLNKFMDYHLIKTSESSVVPREALKIGTLLGLPESFIQSLKKLY